LILFGAITALMLTLSHSGVRDCIVILTKLPSVTKLSSFIPVILFLSSLFEAGLLVGMLLGAAESPNRVRLDKGRKTLEWVLLRAQCHY